MMGSPETEPERRPREGPQHEVTLKEFLMGRTPVTQSQWRVVAALPQVNRELVPDPSRFNGASHPVECVSWYEAVEYCDRLSQYLGDSYRLPSEAEWEYACRAGTITPFHFGRTLTPELANYACRNSYADGPIGRQVDATIEVGRYPPNAWGLSDMHGNVFEWCQDHWHKTYQDAPNDGRAWVDDDENDNCSRIIRGGSWGYDPRYCRSAYRSYRYPVVRSYGIGFRVVVSAPRTS